MSYHENIDPNHRPMGPLLEGDQAVIDAVEQVDPGISVRGKNEFGRSNWNGPENVYLSDGKARFLAPLDVRINSDGIEVQNGNEYAVSEDHGAYRGERAASRPYETDIQAEQEIKKRAAATILERSREFGRSRRV